MKDEEREGGSIRFRMRGEERKNETNTIVRFMTHPHLLMHLYF